MNSDDLDRRLAELPRTGVGEDFTTDLLARLDRSQRRRRAAGWVAAAASLVLVAGLALVFRPAGVPATSAADTPEAMAELEELRGAIELLRQEATPARVYLEGPEDLGLLVDLGDPGDREAPRPRVFPVYQAASDRVIY